MTTMIPILLSAICTSGPVIAPSSQDRLPREMVPIVTVDNLQYSSLFKQDEKREIAGQAPAFAVPTKTSITPATNGIWERVDIDTQRWTLRVSCENALSMNVGFGRYNMPSSGSMEITDSTRDFRIRSFTADDNKTHGQLWTPVVPGNEAIIEIVVDNDQKVFVVKGIELTSINSGYRWVQDASGRGSSESCNIDVVCSEGDAWWDEIPSVGVYTLNGYLTCTGVMMNNTAQDQTPYFLTANHCGVTPSSDSSIVVYWNHQNSYCRVPGSNDSGGNGNGTFNQFTSGSTMRATRSYSDFTLTELSSNPSAAYGVTYSGWSRASSASLGSGIHHPEAAEKRISFPDTVQASGEYWDVNWGEGRTAPGSSGSPLYDGNHRVIGQLCCGSSYCPNDLNDYYGRSLNLSWSGGNANSLSSWLDPAGTDAQAIDTLVPGGGGDPEGACCVGTSCTYGTEANCNAIGGTYQGDYVSCSTSPCAAVVGACCFGTSCFEVSEAQCASSGGAWIGDNTTCGTDTCGSPSTCEADIDGDGSVDVSDVLVMVSVWGTNDADADINGDGTVSVADLLIVIDSWGPCEGGGDPTGACCVSANCTIATEANCSAAGGTYNGDNSSCAGDPCGGGGGCEAGWTEDCQGTCFPDYVYESWVGDGYCDDGQYQHDTEWIYLDCVEFGYDMGDCAEPVDLPVNLGACCIGNLASCDERVCQDLTYTDCIALDGQYVGENTQCQTETCLCPPGQIADCNGNCFPIYYLDDGLCHEGQGFPANGDDANSYYLSLECFELACDGGDCSGICGGACCLGGECMDDFSSEGCAEK
ncbi:MAG: hypothetical protein HOC27_00005, partial [Phycisphaerae bacterium]|nr:hypothetical protein [Phycisphaerae bacterium]